MAVMMGTVLLVGILAAGVVGLGLAWFGLRGRRINDHPICRACGFDLLGVYPEIAVCPECGRALVGELAPARGRVQRSPRMLLAGGVLLVSAGLFVTPAFLSGKSAASFAKLKPRAVLLWDIRHGSAPVAGAALDEIQRRAGSAAHPAEASAAVTAILDRQEQRDLAWDSRLGEYVEQAAAAGRIPTGQVERYFEHVTDWSVKGQSRLHDGDPLDLEVWATIDARAGMTGRFGVVAAIAAASLDGDVQEIEERGPPASVNPAFEAWQFAAGQSQSTQTLASMSRGRRLLAIRGQAGPHVLRTMWNFELIDLTTDMLVDTWVVPLDMPLTIIPAGQPLTPLYHGTPEEAAAVRSSISVRVAEVSEGVPGGYFSVRLVCTVELPPFDLAFRPVLLQHGVPVATIDEHDSAGGVRRGWGRSDLSF